MALIKTPGCSLWASVGEGPNRGQHAFNGLNFVVTSNILYSIDDLGVVSDPIGRLTTKSGRVSIQDNGLLSNGIGGNQLIIVDGKAGWIYDVIAKTFNKVYSAGFPANPTHVEYIDGYFIVTDDTMNAYASELYDGTTWKALATTPVESAPDNVRVPVAYGEELIFIKEYTTEFYANNGTPTINGFPFSRISGAVAPTGTSSPWSVCQGAGSIFWLATERKKNHGEFIGPVLLTGETTTTPVGNQAIIYIMSQWQDRENAFTYSYSAEGHTFFVVTSPGDNQTLVYDSTTNMWHERSTYVDSPFKFGRHIGNSYTYFNGMHLIGDYKSGNIYRMSSDRFTDIGKPIVCIRRTSHLFDKQGLERLFISKFEIDADIQLVKGSAKAEAQAVDLDTLATFGGEKVTFEGDIVTMRGGVQVIINYFGPPPTPSGIGLADIKILDKGFDYTVPPVVVVQSVDGFGSGATAEAVLNCGEITEIKITTPGTGYKKNPNIIIVDQHFLPSIGLSYSKDSGKTYLNERIKQGRFVFWKLGESKDRIWQIRVDDKVKTVLLGGYAEVE